MYIKQLYTGCLAHAAYYIESNGEAAIIDPLRETEPYTQLAEERGAKIKYIFETHFHADFVSGHVDLAKKTGAKIVYGPGASTTYDIVVANDNEVFQLGEVSFTVLHTPGHTLESSTFLLKDETGKDNAIFSGDTLFIGDVGRPDLAIKSDLTKEDLAGMLFESLHNKIMPLADDVLIYPGHGAGSACGKNMSKETFATLGHQKEFNYALQALTKEEFVKQLLDGIAPPPQYFPKNAMMNKMGYESIDEVIEHGMQALTVAEAMAYVDQGALLLDTRHESDFVKGHIPGSLFIGVNGSFAGWVGALVPDITRPIVYITDAGAEHEVVMRLARVGYDNTLGFIEGGVDAYVAAGKQLAVIESISPATFADRFAADDLTVLDVRKPGEYETQHVEGAINFPLDYINDTFQELDADKEYYVHCKGGYRSVIFTSILQSVGFKNIVNIEAGFDGIKETSAAVTASTCSSAQ